MNISRLILERNVGFFLVEGGNGVFAIPGSIFETQNPCINHQSFIFLHEQKSNSPIIDLLVAIFSNVCI